MVNNRYHLLYNIASSAPPAGVVLSRFLGGGIGRTNVYERILREPTGIEFIDNQIMRESGVSGMKPMNEHELEEYIRMWLQGLVRNSPESMPLADLKDEMDRVRGALATARMFYHANGGAGKDQDIESVLGALETAYDELRKIKTSLEQEQERDLLREMEIRSTIDSAVGDQRAVLQAELAGLIQKRKGSEDRERELAEVRQAQALALKKLEESWVEYLKQLMDELHVARDTLDLTNPRAHFRRILREQLDQAKQADQPNVTTYLQIVERALGSIVHGDMVDMLPEEDMYKGLHVLLNDIRDYYTKTRLEKEAIEQALQKANERIRLLNGNVKDENLVVTQSVADMLEQLLNRVEHYQTAVKDLQESLRAQTAELEASQATVLELRRAKEMYEGILRDILGRFVLDEHKAQVLADFSNLPGYIKQYIDSIQDEIGKSAVKSDAQGKELIALNAILKDYLEPLNQLLTLFVGKVGGVQVINPDAANQLLKRLRELAQTAQQAALNATGQIPEKITLVITIINLIVDLIGRYEREKESFNIFFNEVRNKLGRPEAQPDEALLRLDALNQLAEITGQRLQANANKIADLEQQLADLTAARETDKTNMEALREQNAAELKAAEERVKAVQEEMERNRTASEEEKARVQQQLDAALAQIHTNQADLEAARKEAADASKAHKKAIKQLQTALTEAKAQITSIADEKRQLNDTIANLGREMATLRNQKLAMEQRLKKANDEVTQQLAALRAQVGDDPQAYTLLYSNYQGALAALENGKTALAGLQAQLNEKVGQLQVAQGQLTALDQGQQQLRTEIDQYKEEELKLKAQLRESEQQLIEFQMERVSGPAPIRFREQITDLLIDPVDSNRLMKLFSLYMTLCNNPSSALTAVPDIFQVNFDLLTGVFLFLKFKKMKIVNKRLATLYEIFYLMVYSVLGVWLNQIRTAQNWTYNTLLECLQDGWESVILQGGSSHISLSACWDVCMLLLENMTDYWKCPEANRGRFVLFMYQKQIDFYQKGFDGIKTQIEAAPFASRVAWFDSCRRDISHLGGLPDTPDLIFLAAHVHTYLVLYEGEDGFTRLKDEISRWSEASEFFVAGDAQWVPMGKMINTEIMSIKHLVERPIRMCAEDMYYNEAEILADFDKMGVAFSLQAILNVICKLFSVDF